MFATSRSEMKFVDVREKQDHRQEACKSTDYESPALTSVVYLVFCNSN